MTVFQAENRSKHEHHGITQFLQGPRRHYQNLRDLLQTAIKGMPFPRTTHWRGCYRAALCGLHCSVLALLHAEEGVEPSHSPDLAPGDFHVSGPSRGRCRALNLCRNSLRRGSIDCWGNGTSVTATRDYFQVSTPSVIAITQASQNQGLWGTIFGITFAS
jgi:hypothetical protein